MKKSILIICRNHLAKAPRFMMEVNALKDYYNLIAAGESYDASTSDFEFVSLIKEFLAFHYGYPTFFKKIISFGLHIYFKFPFAKRSYSYEVTVKHNFKTLKKKQFDLIIVHHFKDIPLAVKLADLKKVNIIFNAHEYYPLEFDDSEEWVKNTQPTYLHIAKTYLNKVSICFCVGQIIADKYKKEFGLHSVVIPNAKPFYDLQPTLLKESEKIKIIHHGGAEKSRKIELTIEMMQYLGQGYQLDLILIPGSEEYIEEIKEKAKPYSNIRFLEPVPLYDIPTFLNTYDIGLFLLPPTNYNYANALPNKFFEFVQARLAIAIAPSPEMALLTQKYDLGVVAPDFTPQALANKIKELTVEKIMYHKNQCHKHAKELSSGVYQDLIKKTVDELV